MMMTPAVTTVDFYEGADVDAAAAHLRLATAAAVEANPWLLGTLARRRDRVWLRAACTEARARGDAVFAEAEDPAAQADSDASYEDVARSLARFAVPRSGACVDAVPAPLLFRVTLVRASGSAGRFAVVVSLSHVVGDGSTFYALRAMLGLGAGARPLNAQRHLGFSAGLRSLLGGGNDTLAFLTSAGATAGVLRTLLLSPRAQAMRADVSADWVAKEKARACAGNGAAFVSTNDVVTSALLRALRCDVGLMSVNFRGRAAPRADDAGNYEALVGYNSCDYTTPALLRSSLQHPGGGVRRVEGGRQLPGGLAAATCRVGLVSTWATFFTELVLPGGARLRHHLPIIDTCAVPFADIAILFRPSPSALAVLLLSRSLTQAQLVCAMSGGAAA